MLIPAFIGFWIGIIIGLILSFAVIVASQGFIYLWQYHRFAVFLIIVLGLIGALIAAMYSD